MVVNFLMFALVVGAIYIFAYPDSQLAATTSAIGQIWSGSCRLSCRQSQYSGYSGLSGLVPGHSQDTKGFFVARTSVQATNRCVCASCPCELIENVLRTCRPATSMYSSAVQFIATMYYSALEALYEMYNYVERVFNCRISCQRPQLIDNRGSGSETIYFGKKHRDNLEKAKEKTKKTDSGVPNSKSIVFRDASDATNKREESSTKKAPSSSSIKIGVSDGTLKPDKEEEETKSVISEASNSCPRCIKQGKVCMKKCPKAKNKKK